jgi:hypothetical protein
VRKSFGTTSKKKFERETKHETQTIPKTTKNYLTVPMSCFWDGLRRKVPGLQRFAASEVRKALQSVNVPTVSVTLDGKPFTAQQLRENVAWIAADNRPWNDGHDTPVADPFIALVCEVFCCNVTFHVTGTTHRFVHPRATTTLEFTATAGHFS